MTRITEMGRPVLSCNYFRHAHASLLLHLTAGQSHATAIRSSSASLRTTMDSSNKPSPSAAVAASRRRRPPPSTDPAGAAAGVGLSRLKLCSGAAERSRPVCGGEKGEEKRKGGGGSEERKAKVEEIIRRKGVRVVAADMGEEMQLHAVVCARKTYDSLEKFAAKSLALALKKEFDGAYGPAWHCVVGKSFGSFVTHSVGGFVYLCMDKKIYVLLFKTAVLRAG